MPSLPTPQTGFSSSGVHSHMYDSGISHSDPVVSHLLTEVSKLSQSVGAMMNMVNNMFISWNDIILQTANKATAVHSEVQ